MKKVVILAVILLVALQFPLFRHFCLTQLGSFLIYQDQITPADAILVLGGGEKERAVQGIELYKNKYAGWMLFTGEYQRSVFAEPTHWAIEAQKLAVYNGVNQARTIPILSSNSTYTDAVLSRDICLKRHFRSLIVVSEPYHTRRAHFVFKKVYKDTGIKIMVYPVQNSAYKRDSWWKYQKGFWDTNIEYQKMVYYLCKGYLI